MKELGMYIFTVDVFDWANLYFLIVARLIPIVVLIVVVNFVVCL